jgi:hypothetical protein
LRAAATYALKQCEALGFIAVETGFRRVNGRYPLDEFVYDRATGENNDDVYDLKQRTQPPSLTGCQTCCALS